MIVVKMSMYLIFTYKKLIFSKKEKNYQYLTNLLFKLSARY